MACEKRRSMRAIALVVVLCLIHGDVFAWCPIAHYLIARAAAKKKGIHNPHYRVEHYANLPDYEESKKWNFADGDMLGIGKQVTRKFCWSHAVLDVSGTLPFPIGAKLVAPGKPSYPDDGRYPGPLMAELLRRVLDLRGIAEGSERHWDLMNTVNGFRAHNAADRQVHFEWFEGATRDRSYEDRTEAWVAHHGLKEVWADYHLLEFYGYASKAITWGVGGNILTNIVLPSFWTRTGGNTADLL